MTVVCLEMAVMMGECGRGASVRHCQCYSVMIPLRYCTAYVYVRHDPAPRQVVGLGAAAAITVRERRQLQTHMGDMAQRLLAAVRAQVAPAEQVGAGGYMHKRWEARVGIGVLPSARFGLCVDLHVFLIDAATICHWDCRTTSTPSNPRPFVPSRPAGQAASKRPSRPHPPTAQHAQPQHPRPQQRRGSGGVVGEAGGVGGRGLPLVGRGVGVGCTASYEGGEQRRGLRGDLVPETGRSTSWHAGCGLCRSVERSGRFLLLQPLGLWEF